MQKTIYTLLFFTVFSLASLGQSLPVDEHNITPTIDSTFSHNVYIPKHLEDCFRELNKMLTDELVEEIKSFPTEKELLKRHNADGLGVWIQRNWGFQDLYGSRLSRHLHGLGIYHPSQMSAVILSSYWRHLNGEPIRGDDQMPLLQKF